MSQVQAAPVQSGGSITISAGNGASTSSGGYITITGGRGGSISLPKPQAPSPPKTWTKGKITITVGQKYLLTIPKEFQHLAPDWTGKKVTVVSINSQPVFFIEVQHPALKGDPVRNICAVEPSWLEPLCVCNLTTLLHQGCKCGGV